MTWLILALLSALSFAVKNILTKRISDKTDAYTVAFASNLFSIPLLWIIVFYVGLPKVETTAWEIIAIMLPFEILIALLYFHAIKISPLSLSIPFTSFTPLFVAIGGFFILNENLSYHLFFALILMVLGAYIINLEKLNKANILKPFTSLLKEQGPLLMISVAILWGITNPLGKIAIENSSPYFFVAMYTTLFALLYSPIFFTKSTKGIFSMQKHFLLFSCIGLFNVLFLIFTWIAISMGPVALVNAVSMFSIPLTILFAGAFLAEKQLLKRFLATICMIAGTLILIFNQ